MRRRPLASTLLGLLGRRGIVETTQMHVKYFGRLLQVRYADSFVAANG